MQAASLHDGNGEGSSHNRARNELDGESEGSDNEGHLRSNPQDDALLDEDFLAGESPQQVSFKRKQKLPAKLSLPSFLTPLPNPSLPSVSKDQQQLSSATIRHLREQSSRNASDLALSSPGGQASEGATLQEQKDGGPLDWYGDGPRRRVDYDDLTAIDWIFEYTKERQRLRMLYSRATGILGQINRLVDASQVWLVLIGTGLLSGVLAATIDVASDWLGDLKTGYCKAGVGGGHFYLNKGFCCWGHEKWAECTGWTPWSSALHITSTAGGFIVEYLFFIAYSVLFAVCAAVLVQNYATYAKHSGIPEIKTVLGGFVIRRFMSAWTLLIKSLGLCLAVASGLWVGKEGPLVHVSCCCANLLMKFSSGLNDNEARKREVLSAAAAAGISVAFGSPIGGVLFSLEQLSFFFPDKTMWQSFVCAMVAAVTLQLFNPYRTGQLVLYQVTYSSGWHDFELVPFAILGILGGVYGGLFIKLNMQFAKWRKGLRISQSPVLEVFLVATITALVNFPNTFMRAQTSELLYVLFAECSSIQDDQFGICGQGAAYVTVLIQLLLAAILGFIFASVTFGLKIPSGVILPSMAIGALYGRALGIVVQILQEKFPDLLIFINCEPDIPCITPGTYGIVGAASALGGVTRMTVSIVVIMFELTGALTYVLPIMIAVMLSKWVGDAFGKRGIYESWIHLNEYPFLDNRDDSLIPDIPVAQIMTKVEDMSTLTSTGHTLQSLHEFLMTNPQRGFPVVADHTNNILLGYITRTELVYALKSATSVPRKMPPTTEVFFSHQPSADPLNTVDLRPWMDQTPMTLNAKSTFQLTVDMFRKLGLKYVLFCDRGALRGLLTKKDIWYALNSDYDVVDDGVPINTRTDRSSGDRSTFRDSINED